MDQGSGDLGRRDSYLSCSSPASNGLATITSQTLDEPTTPAAASTASFESIDLDSSPERKPLRQGGTLFSPNFASINEDSSSAALKSGRESPEG